jgi:hypothetical protein
VATEEGAGTAEVAEEVGIIELLGGSAGFGEEDGADGGGSRSGRGVTEDVAYQCCDAEYGAEFWVVGAGLGTNLAPVAVFLVGEPD